MTEQTLWKWCTWILLSILIVSCNSEEDAASELLSVYLSANQNFESAEVIACAGGREEGLVGTADFPTDIFFYPVNGATDFRYYESIDVDNPDDFTAYRQVDLDDEPIFNGYLRKFNNVAFEGERFGIVTYITNDSLHISNPIRLKTNVKPTEVNPSLVDIDIDGVSPTFDWQDGLIEENAIYFQVISDTDGNLISGTYTFETNFTFYDLENVVLNITDPSITPMLDPDTEYHFTMMAVSLDNWVNLLIQESFMTE